MENAIDLYDPLQMTMNLQEAFPAHRFLTDLFFSESEVHDTRFFQFDIEKGQRRMAPFVNRKAQGKVIERHNYKTVQFEPPYIKEKMITTTDQILKRSPGEVVYTTPGSNTPLERAARQLGQDAAEMSEMIVRRIEWMAAQGLFFGIIPVSGEGVEYDIDFLFESSHLITLDGTLGNEKWSDLATKILAQLRRWKKLITKDSSLTANILLLGCNVYDNFINNEQVLKLLDNRRVEIGSIVPEELGDGVTYVGDLKSVGLSVWSYDEWYYDEATQTELPMVPENMILLASTRARCKRHYGVIEDVEAGNFATEAFVKSWTEPDPSGRFLMVQSAPLPTIEQPNGFVAVVVQDPAP